MAHMRSISPQVAQQVLWTYRGISEEEMEKNFYVALEDAVAAEITRRSQGGSRIWVGREMQFPIGAYTVRARLTNIEPLLATVSDGTTRFLAEYRELGKDEGQDISNFLSEVIRYPDERFGNAFDALVGLDWEKKDVQRKLLLLLSPGSLENWVSQTYANNPPHMLLRVLHERYPLIILEGEVGSGKTALARSIGHRLAVKMNTELALFIVNAQVRGGGHVGELTQNISRAFTEAERCQEREQIPVMVLIDEADALAQSRGGRQTHHEDDAGVNTLIQRIDRLRGRPIAVLFATNLVQSLDAAILRRSIVSYHFVRPSAEQRAEVFRRLLANVGIGEKEIALLVSRTEPRRLPSFKAVEHRYTYSDLSQRIIPHAVEEAVFARQPISLDHLINACEVTLPTPEMQVAS